MKFTYLLSFLVIFSTLIAVNHATAGDTLFISTDGSGDYNCDGVSDQVQINEALDFVAAHSGYTTVFLKGPDTYWIDEPIVISSNTHLTGDSTAKVQLTDNTDWPLNKPLIHQKGGAHWNDSLEYAIYGTTQDAISNVEISGFELTAGNQNASPGSWAYILMIFYTASDLTIHDMYLHGSYGDIIRIMTPGPPYMNTNMKFYNNVMEDSGHEGLYIGYAADLEIYDNEIYTTRTNDGIRIGDSCRLSIHGNTIGNSLTRVPSGYAGIVVSNAGQPIESAEIYDNYIFGKAGGIVLEAESSGDDKDLQRDVHIHHNRLYKIFDNTAGGDDFLNGGIHIYGAHNTLIENNTIEGSYKDGIVYEMGSHSGTGYQTIVRNNIISNSIGYGINNRGGSEHTFICNYNTLYNNGQGDYHDASSTTDIYVNPLFVAATGTDPVAVDFHIKSEDGHWSGSGWINDSVTSPCIDQGDPSSDFTSEPSYNGGRVNIGAYGNTAQASKSDYSGPVYTVTFVTGSHGVRIGGGALVQTINEGEDATAPVIQAETGYIFTGWDKSLLHVTEDLTIAATYSTSSIHHFIPALLFLEE
jgi:parallel beta-helix repeat protein